MMCSVSHGLSQTGLSPPREFLQKKTAFLGRNEWPVSGGTVCKAYIDRVSPHATSSMRAGSLRTASIQAGSLQASTFPYRPVSFSSGIYRFPSAVRTPLSLTAFIALLSISSSWTRARRTSLAGRTKRAAWGNHYSRTRSISSMTVPLSRYMFGIRPTQT